MIGKFYKVLINISLYDEPISGIRCTSASSCTICSKLHINQCMIVCPGCPNTSCIDYCERPVIPSHLDYESQYIVEIACIYYNYKNQNLI